MPKFLFSVCLFMLVCLQNISFSVIVEMVAINEEKVQSLQTWHYNGITKKNYVVSYCVNLKYVISSKFCQF